MGEQKLMVKGAAEEQESVTTSTCFIVGQSISCLQPTGIRGAMTCLAKLRVKPLVGCFCQMHAVDVIMLSSSRTETGVVRAYGL